MVEYLLVPAALLLIAMVAATQFLLQGVRYGPRSRRTLRWLVVPALLSGVGAAQPVSVAWWLRALVAIGTAAATYLALAGALVLRWRNRKLVALVGDVPALRQRVATRRRELQRLFWLMAAGPVLPADRAAPDSPVDWKGVVDRWCAVVPARAAQVRQWRAEFRRVPRAELAGRARVLEAAVRDAPAGEGEALRARLGVLWLAHAQAETPGDGAAHVPDAGTARLHWERTRHELAHLQEELAHLLHQRSTLLRQRLPLD